MRLAIVGLQLFLLLGNGPASALWDSLCEVKQTTCGCHSKPAEEDGFSARCCCDIQPAGEEPQQARVAVDVRPTLAFAGRLAPSTQPPGLTPPIPDPPFRDPVFGSRSKLGLYKLTHSYLI